MPTTPPYWITGAAACGDNLARPPFSNRRIRPNSSAEDLRPTSHRDHGAWGDRVKRLTDFLLGAFAAVIFFAGGVGTVVTPASAAQDETIIFLGDKTYAPYESLVDGKPVGINVDLITAIGKTLSQPVEIRLMKWSDAQANVLSGAGHALTFMSRNPQRMEDYDFSESTFTPEFVFFTTSEQADKFDIWALSKVRIGVVSGGFSEAYLKQNHPEAELVRIESELDGFTKLFSSTIDAVATSKLTGYYAIKKHGILGIEAVGEPFAVKIAGIAVPKGNPELVRRLNEALRTLKKNGEFDDIIVKWMGDWMSSDASPGIPIYLIVSYFAVILTAAALLLWSIVKSRAADPSDSELLTQGFNARYLIAGFVAIIAMMVFLEAYSINQTLALTSLTQKLYRHPFAVTNAILTAHADILSMDRSMHHLAIVAYTAEIESAVDKITRYNQLILNSFDIILDRFLGDRSRAIVARKSFLKWASIQQEGIDLMQNGGGEEAVAEVEGRNKAQLADLEEKMLALNVFAHGKAAMFVADSQQQHAIYTMTMYALVVATIVLGVGISAAMVLAVMKYGQLLQANARRLHRLAGQFEQRVDERTAELSAANAELETFAYSVSHDLRSPLRGLDGFSRILLRDYSASLDDKARHYLDRIRKASQKMAMLINDILELSRSSRVELKCETIDLSEMARVIFEQFALTEPDRRVTIEIAEGLEADGDPNQVAVLLESLLGNAWKFTAKTDRPEIVFGADTHDGRKVFFVRDNGAGFDMAFSDKLYAPFQRLHGADEFEGTGIGLSIVNRIINRHGGEVWAEAEIDKGATFYFSFNH